MRISDGDGQYEARTDDDDAVVGIAAYRLDGDVITFTHTQVDLEGHGVGGQLARFALDDARARGLTVRPLCPFIRSWIEKHQDYADLVA